MILNYDSPNVENLNAMDLRTCLRVVGVIDLFILGLQYISQYCHCYYLHKLFSRKVKDTNIKKKTYYFTISSIGIFTHKNDVPIVYSRQKITPSFSCKCIRPLIKRHVSRTGVKFYKIIRQ